MKKINTVSWMVRNDTNKSTGELERYYQKFLNSDNIETLQTENIDMDIFSFETAAYLSNFFEKHGMNLIVKISEQILPTMVCNKDDISQVLSAMTYTCLDYADKTKGVHFEVEKREDHKLNFSLTYVAGNLHSVNSEQEVLNKLRKRTEQKGYEFQSVCRNGFHTISLLI